MRLTIKVAQGAELTLTGFHASKLIKQIESTHGIRMDREGVAEVVVLHGDQCQKDLFERVIQEPIDWTDVHCLVDGITSLMHKKKTTPALDKTIQTFMALACADRTAKEASTILAALLKCKDIPVEDPKSVAKPKKEKAQSTDPDVYELLERELEGDIPEDLRTKIVGFLSDTERDLDTGTELLMEVRNVLPVKATTAEEISAEIERLIRVKVVKKSLRDTVKSFLAEDMERRDLNAGHELIIALEGCKNKQPKAGRTKIVGKDGAPAQVA